MRIGIDNGKDGAVVGVMPDWSTVVLEMPILGNELDERAVYKFLQRMKACSPHDIYAVLEYAQVMPKQGSVSGFTIGRGYGAMRMALIALEIPFEIVRPRVWQKDVGIVVPANVKDRSKRRKIIKEQSVKIVRRRLPSVDLTPGKKRTPQDGIADAACMALHATKLQPWRSLPIPPPPPLPGA